MTERVLWQGHPVWQSMIGWYAKWHVLTCVPFVLMFVLAHYGHFSLALAIVYLLAATGTVQGAGLVIRRSYTYRITSKRVHESTGVLSKHTEEAPLARIDNVVVNRTLGERMLGIGTLEFETSAEHSNLVWRGIRDPVAVKEKIEYVQDGDAEPAHLQPEPEYRATGYIERDQPRGQAYIEHDAGADDEDEPELSRPPHN